MKSMVVIPDKISHSIKMWEQEIKQVDCVKYLGTVMESTGKIPFIERREISTKKK